MTWHQAIEQVKPYVMRISTPQGSGTGWLMMWRMTTNSLCIIATAAHVVDHAHYWESPIRLRHEETGKSIVLRASERAILIDDDLDSAVIVFREGELRLPQEMLPMIQNDEYTKAGVEVGWLGYPAISQAGLCFFSGRISTYIEPSSTYLVDGVAINGVSGGPAFSLFGKSTVEMIGIVSAYIPNRATGEILPGVAVIRDVTHFHKIIADFKTLDEAKESETIPVVEPVPPTEPSAKV